MRIGFEAKRATHNFRGLGNYARGIIEGLTEYFPENEYFLYTPKIRDNRAIDWKKNLSGKVYFRTPETTLARSLSGLWRSYLINGELRQDKLSLFHGLSHELPYGVSDQVFKKLVTIHDLIFIRYPQFFPWIDRIVYKEKFQYACSEADVVIAICHQTKEDLIHLLKVPEEKIVVHYQSCDPIFYEKKNQIDCKPVLDKYDLKKDFILMVGAFEERKNQKTLVEAFHKIANKFDIELVLVGAPNSYQHMIRKRILDLDLSSKVRILDTVSFSELPMIYQSAKLFCFPSLFEGFGIPITEALFSKIPVITSHGSCFPESAGPNSVYIDPLSVNELSLAIENVLRHEEKSLKMVFDGYEYAQKFHREHTTNELMKIYVSLGK